jgi:L-fuculose-phosphate aldolase
MAITPSGMDYYSISPMDIVEVNISDCSYRGDVKPSVEKGIHATVYKLHPEMNFVIHTHQVNASVAGVLGLKSLDIVGDYPLLGGNVPCAEYGIPGSKKLCKHVTKSLKSTKGNAVIMIYHGALCFGKNQEEAFDAATQLEKACDDFVKNQYMTISGEKHFDLDNMRHFALSRINGAQNISTGGDCLQYDSERTENGFRLLHEEIKSIEVAFDRIEKCASANEIKIHNEIYKRHKSINYIKYSNKPNTKEVASLGLNLKPLLDDFAQIVGTNMKTTEKDACRIASTLKKSSAVFIRNEGALCVGNSRNDAEAVAMILEKNCKTLVGAALFDHIKPINWLECFAMRFFYKNKYSKTKLKTTKQL